MGQKYDSCIKKIKAKIKKGEIPKTFKRGKKRIKSNPYKICKSKMSAKKFNKKYWGESRW